MESRGSGARAAPAIILQKPSPPSRISEFEKLTDRSQNSGLAIGSGVADPIIEGFSEKREQYELAGATHCHVRALTHDAIRLTQ